jgi:hypothetical protein
MLNPWGTEGQCYRNQYKSQLREQHVSSTKCCDWHHSQKPLPLAYHTL